MSSARWIAAVVLAVSLASPAPAQTSPHIGYVYPAGGRQGTTFQVKLGGQFLEGASQTYVSGTGVRTAVIEYIKPLTQGEVQRLKEQMQELMKKKNDPEARKQIVEIRRKIAKFNRNANPAIAELVMLRITIDADAEPGPRELRLAGARGLTNPVVFCVGQLPEFSEPPPPDGADAKNPAESQGAARRSETAITLPATVNGQIMPSEAGQLRFARQGQQPPPGDVDRYRFHARKGQRLVVAASARELIPYLADAVPGWFQAALALYDADGKELAYDDDYRFHPDPILFTTIPKDGEYVIEIRDAIYRGRADFVYRISVGELPLVTGIFPLGGRAGSPSRVELQGWDLPASELTMDAKDKGPGVYPVLVRRGELFSNRMPFAVGELPECLEREPNDRPEVAQGVALPMVINGRIDRPGDWDLFRIEGKAGQKIVAEVTARRLESPLDSVLKLTDAGGRQLAYNDDHEDKGAGLYTHHADSLLTATLPADGTYYVHVGDAQHQGGREYAYRLRISEPRPDFELRIAPSSINARGGMAVPITVYVLRKDGFSGEIALSLQGAPAGYALNGAVVPADQDQIRLTLTAASASQEPLTLLVEGRATIAGRPLVRRAVPADDLMQAFAYRHLVPAKDLMVTTLGGLKPRGQPSGARKAAKVAKAESWIRLRGDGPVKIPAGGTTQMHITMASGAIKDQLQLELSEPPDGIAIEKVSSDPQGMAVVVQSDAKKVKPGMKGNLIVNASVTRPTAPGKKKGRPDRQRVPLGMLPAIPFEIVQP